MFSHLKYVDVRLAIGELVMSGVGVRCDVERITPRIATCTLLDADTNECIAPTFRDGTSWKVRTETVQDYIDDHQLATFRQSVGA